MRQASKNIVKRLSARRRHQWKYVSPRRRRFGLFVLALLLGLFYGGWYVTNDSFIRRKTESELEEQMATDVDVESAEFDIQEGIRLFGVRLWDIDPVEGNPFLLLYAEEVVLKFSNSLESKETWALWSWAC